MRTEMIAPAALALTLLVASAAPVAAQEDDTVLSNFSNDNDFLLWFQKDIRAGLTSKAVREILAKRPEAARNIYALLASTKGSWLVLRDPASRRPWFATHFDGGVTYGEVSASVELENKEVLPRAGVYASHDRLAAVYGSASSGTVVVLSYAASAGEGGAIQLASQAGALYYEGGDLTEARASAPEALEAVFAEPRISKEAASRPRVSAFLEGGAGRLAEFVFNGSGALMIKLKEKGQDKFYIFPNGKDSTEFPVG